MTGRSNKSTKYIIILLFVLLSILSVFLMGKVNINYNISDYLAEDTETKISLNIIEDEFGMTGDIQVMVEDVDVDTAKDIQSVIKNIPNVLTVNFNENDENYYKDGNALFAVIVDGDEYSDVANTVLDDIGEELDENFTTNYGGSVVAKRNLRKAIQSEIVMILAVALCLVVVIMLLTSSSWLEPFVLLLASGVAILLNMGTNLLFGEISYITNAVAAILQLALSVDYSIVLLHSYNDIKKTEEDSGRAMMLATKSVLRPVSASALTTMTGLLALLFMTMKIGFDIGIVLMKGILISAVVSLTLLPAMLLVFEKLMNKTAKRPFVLKSEGFCKFAIKAGKVIVPIALVVIIVGGTLQTRNTYSFTDSSGDNRNITDTFGKNSTIIVVYPNEDKDYQGETVLAEKLKDYKTADGKTVLKNYTAYSNTVRELYDIEKATEKLNMPESDIEMLFVMYHLYSDSARVELTPMDFVKYTEGLAENDADAQSFMGEDTAKTVRTLIAIDEIMNGSHTAEQFHDLVNEAVPDSDLELFAIKQMYGLYFYDSITEKAVDFETMLEFAVDAVNNSELGDMLSPEAASGLVALSDGIDQFKEQMDKPMTKSEFREYMLTEQGTELSESQLDLLYSAYSASTNDVIQDTIPLLSLMNYLVESGQITDADAIAGIESLNQLYALDIDAFIAQMEQPMSRTDFKEYMLTEQGIELTDVQVALLYFSYFADIGETMQDTIPFLPLMNYLVKSGQVTDDDAIAGIELLNELYAMDLYSIKAQLDQSMTAAEFREYMLTEQGTELDESQVKLIYAAYSASINDVSMETIPFLPLMNYLVESGQVTDADAIAKIDSLDELYADIPNAYEYDEFMPLIEQAATTLTGEAVELNVDDLAIQQLYIMYFYDQKMIPSNSIVGRDFVDFVIETGKENSVVGSQLSEDTNMKLADVCRVDEFLLDKNSYDFKEMTAKIDALQKDIKSLSASGELGESVISGVYIKYAISEDLGLNEPIMACDILDFVVENMDSHGILSAKMSETARSKVEGAQEAMDSAGELLVGENYSRMLLSIDLPSESAESSSFVEYLLTAVKESLGEDAHVAGEMVSTYDLQVSFADDNKLISIFTIVSIFIIIMILFRSLSLPVILVAVIQGAIWIAMSTSLVTGPIFFMSYIMATCILMGSTIDYGILMSTNYVQYRTTMDKKEALYKSVKAAMPTIFTSGLILTICGFVVGFIASQNSISTVGVLIGKGTLVSTVMITVVLPAVLYLLDGFILKLSMKSKNKK